jgi:ABC-type dipeptide/oligopeptide/nickel transport system permease component
MSSSASQDPAEDVKSSAGSWRRWLLIVLYHPVTRKVGRSLAVAFGVMVVAFLVMRVAPGDPALLLAGDDATPEAIEAFREKLGLNGSLLQQFWDYFRGLLLHLFE